MNQRNAKRQHYRKAVEHLRAAKRELVAALNVARHAELKFTASVEKAVAVVEKLEQKFDKESGEA